MEMSRGICLLACLFLCVVLPVRSANGVAVGDSALEAPLQDALLPTKTLEAPDLVGQCPLDECSISSAHSTIDRPSSPIELERVVEKVGKEWQCGSIRSSRWSDKQHLYPNVFWNHIMGSANKQYAQVRSLQDAGVFGLMPRIMTQRAYYETQATDEEKRMIDESWERLFERWWTADSGASAQEGRMVAQRLLKRMDEIAEQVRIKQQEYQGETEEEKREIGRRYVKAIADDLTKECWTSYNPLFQQNSWFNKLASTSQEIHSSLDQLAEDLRKLPDPSMKTYFYHVVRNKRTNQSASLGLKFSKHPATNS
ncbi:hypothetical protein PGTUg99_037699 [Puccinia graminis f. sp. tritici]|uniref:RxLR effector candidate protein n=1 Tax=Puccinia graminis f. sp. tritici TaxID=56615 RepID=A0A5B0RBU4_PUCGR|nr:hypothetical protein PGTUg99_037699 [Puccinia graminis f. sp. tritici]